MTPLTIALVNVIRAEIDNRDLSTIGERVEAVETALRDLIKKELVIHNLVAERNPVD